MRQTYVRKDGTVKVYEYPRRRDTGVSSIRYQFIDGRYRTVKEPPGSGKNPLVVECPSCHRTVRVVIPSGERGYRFFVHNQLDGGGRGAGNQCPMSRQLVGPGLTPHRKRPPKPKPPRQPWARRLVVCPECDRLLDVVVPFGKHALSFVHHHRAQGGPRCPMAEQPIPDDLRRKMMPFTKITQGKDRGKFRSPSGRVMTLAQVQAYYAKEHSKGKKAK